MADPDGYEPQYDFSAYQAANPKRPLPGHELDVELHDISNAMGSTQAALADIRRSDGRLRNGIVDADAIGPTAVGALIEQSTELMEDVLFVVEMYLGQLAEDPETGRDGADLEPSNWYYNTVTEGYRYYTADGWRPMTGVATIRQYRFVMTAGQTEISGLDENGFQYFASGESVAVFKNGAILPKATGFTTPDTSTITLASAASDGDVVVVLSFEEAVPAELGRLVRRLHIADGATDTFALPVGVTGIGQVFSVAVDGVVQNYDAYSMVGSNLVLDAMPRNGERVQITAWTAVLAEDSNTRRAYAFSGRAAFIAALGWPWEVGAVVSDRRVQYKYLGTGTAIADAPGWVPFGRVAFDHWEPNTTPGTTAMRGAIIAAYGYLNSIGGGVIDGLGATYAVSAMVDLTDHYNIKTVNCEFVATGVWAANVPMFKLVKGATEFTRMTWEHCSIEGTGEANGWLVDDAGAVSILHCRAHGIPDFAVRSRTKATELRIQNCDFRQFVWGETGFDVEANRTAILIDLDTADYYVYDNTAAYAYEMLRITTRGPGQVRGNHFYNGAQTSATFETRLATIAGPNCSITGNYFDNGIVRIDAVMVDGGGSVNITGNHFHKTSNGTNTYRLEFFGGVNSDLDGLILANNTFAGPTNGVLFTGTYVANSLKKWVVFGNTEGAGSAVAGLPEIAMRSNFIADQINGYQLRSPSYTYLPYGAETATDLKFAKSVRYSADYDNNSGLAESKHIWAVDGTDYMELGGATVPGTLTIGVGQAHGGGGIARIHWSGSDFQIIPADSAGTIFDYAKRLQYHVTDQAWKFYNKLTVPDMTGTIAVLEDSANRTSYAFATRAAFLAALSWTWEVGAIVSDGSVLYEYLGTGTAIPDAPGWVPFDGVDIRHFGAVSGTNATAAILAAATYADSANIQNVKVPAGTYDHTTLDLTDRNVRLVGDGETHSILRYVGANTADGIKFGTSQIATRKVYGAGLVQIGINANGLARRAVDITSIYGGWFESVRILNPFAFGMYWACLDNRLTAANNEPADNQRCHVSQIYVECITEPTAQAIYLDGNAGSAATVGANTSLNHFENIRLNIRNGNGFSFGYADGNTLTGLFVFRPNVNTGVGLVFKEDTASQLRHSRHNICYNIQTAQASVLAEGSGVGTPSTQNAILGYNLGNNGVDFPPTIGATATLQLLTSVASHNLNATAAAIVSGPVTVSSAVMPLVRARMGTESMRISNRANSHMVLERPSADSTTAEAAWGLAVLGASGDAGENLRFTRTSGTGVVEMPSLARAVQSVTGAGTTTLTVASTVLIVDATAGNRTVNLPLASAYGALRTPTIHIRRIDATGNTVTVQRQGSNTLNGGTSETLAENAGKTYVTDATSAWYSF